MISVAVRDWAGNDEGYVLFNNINMYNDALAFNHLLEERIK